MNKQFHQILESIAIENNITVNEVMKEMQLAIDEAQNSTDPIVQARWKSIPRKGTSATPEELVELIAKMISI